MEKLLYIDACFRDEISRTKRIATPIINELKNKYEVETFILDEMNLEIVKKDLMNKSEINFTLREKNSLF